MAAEIWTAMTSLAGVALGGALSYSVQLATHRTAAQAEERRQQATTLESRRAERLTQLERFVEVAADTERCAFGRPAQWADGDDWQVNAQAVMQRFWIAERMIRVVFPLPVHDAARAYFLVLNRAVWEGVTDEESVRDLLEEPRLAFLDAARAALA